MKKYLLILLLAISSLTYAQVNSHFGAGVMLGYKGIASDGGFVVEYKYRNRIDVYIGLSYVDFSGLGYVVGTDVFITNYGWQPSILLGFNRQFGGYSYTGDTVELKTDYLIKGYNSYIVGIGVRKILFEKKDALGFMSFTPYLCYRYTYPESKVIFLDDYINEPREDRINSRIGGGFGGGLKIVYFLNR